MLDIERHKQILAFLKENSGVKVSQLAKTFYVSEPTIRRDLNELEKQGKVKRTFGGVVLIDIQSKEIPLLLRVGENIPEKKLLAQKALEHIRDGNIVFFDASSTVLQMIPLLVPSFKNITAVTNGMQTALDLAKLNITTYCTGGKLLNNSIAFVGNDTDNYLRNINADVMFASCRGYTDGILSDSSIEEAYVRKIMIAQSKRSYFLIDSSKIGKKFFHTISYDTKVTEVITLSKEDREIII